MAVSEAVVDVDQRSGLAASLPAAGDHPELEGEQLVEGQPSERGVAAVERVGVVRLLDRLLDRYQALVDADRRAAGTRDRRSRPCRCASRIARRRRAAVRPAVSG